MVCELCPSLGGCYRRCSLTSAPQGESANRPHVKLDSPRGPNTEAQLLAAEGRVALEKEAAFGN